MCSKNNYNHQSFNMSYQLFHLVQCEVKGKEKENLYLTRPLHCAHFIGRPALCLASAQYTVCQFSHSQCKSHWSSLVNRPLIMNGESSQITYKTTFCMWRGCLHKRLLTKIVSILGRTAGHHNQCVRKITRYICDDWFLFVMMMNAIRRFKWGSTERYLNPRVLLVP